MVDVSRNAPVIERAEAEVNAPVETVWSILSDFSRWPEWNQSVTKMEFPGPLAAGTTFRWVGGGAKITSRIEEVDQLRRLVWSGRTFGIQAYHVWDFHREGDGTRVVTEESFDGWPAKLLRGYMSKTLAKALHEGLTALKSAAESSYRRGGA